jgi:phosphatidate phosphatase PAH1
MFILPESIKTLINGLMTIFAQKEDLKQSDWNQADTTKIDFSKNKPQELSDEEFFNWLSEAKVVEPVAANSGKLYTTNDNKIYIL